MADKTSQSYAPIPVIKPSSSPGSLQRVPSRGPIGGRTSQNDPALAYEGARDFERKGSAESKR